MTTISAGDLVLLRTQQQHSDLYLSVFQPVTLLSALVTGSPVRGARSISYNTGSSPSFATIGAGQTIIFDTASYGPMIGRVKSISGTASSGTITLDENGFLLTNGDAITILHFYEPHPIPPAIRSQIFYKFYDTTYSSQNSTPNPVAIIGSHRAGFLSAGSIVFNITAASSYAIAQGAAISSYAWSCVHNGGGTSGITIASATSATTTLTITTAGQYWLICTVTDSNGKTQTTYRAVFVYDTSNLPYQNFTIESFSGDWQSGGYSASITAHGDVALTDFPDRAIAVIWHKGYFDHVEDYVNIWGISNEVLLAGYIRQDTGRDNWDEGTGEITFQISTMESLLDNKAALGSVSLTAVPSPAYWYEYASWMYPGASIHHLILWHFWGVLETVDIIGLTTNQLGVYATEYTEPTLLQQVNSFAYNRGIGAKLIADNIGRLHFVEDSQLLDDTDRGALDTVLTITDADISLQVDIARQPEKRVVFTQLDGFSFDGTTSTPFISIIPGYRESDVSYIIPEQTGGSLQNVPGQVLESQTDSNNKVGRWHHRENVNPREVRFANPGNYLGAFTIVPSVGLYGWSIADADLKRQIELNGRLFICRHIDAQFIYSEQGFTGIIQTSIVLEPEAIGPPGIQGNYSTTMPTASSPTPSQNIPVLYIGTTDLGVFILQPGGTPTAANTGLSGDQLTGRGIRLKPSTLNSPRNQQVLALATKDGFSYSNNGAVTWTNVSKATLGTPDNTAGDDPAPDTEDLDQIDTCFDPQDGDRRYVLRTTTSPLRAWLYTSDDEGNSWESTQVNT